MRTARSIKAVLPHAIAFLEAANAERATGLPLDQLAHQPGIQDAFVKPGLILASLRVRPAAQAVRNHASA